MAKRMTIEERRLELNSKFKNLLKSNNVYFQPPESVKLKYDCIIYSMSSGDAKFANNRRYIGFQRYEVLHVHRDPDIELIDEFADEFRYCRFDRRFVSDNLYHDVFTIYY